MIKRKIRKTIAILLTLVILLSPCAFAKSINETVIEKDSKALKKIVQITDKIVGNGLEALLWKSLADVTASDDIPDDYDLPIYSGTGGITKIGTQWSMGYGYKSIIPESMRYNAKGERYTGKDNQDINNFRNIRTFTLSNVSGGESKLLTKILTEQQVYVTITSNGCDCNNNGINDLSILISFDGEGVTSPTVQKVRKAVNDALIGKSNKTLTSDDIIVANVDATHCHSVLDTQGMSLPRIIICALLRCVKYLLKRINNPIANLLTPVINVCAMSNIMEKTMCEKAAEAAVDAYNNMEKGTLYFFKTSPVPVSDGLASGVKTQNEFSNLYFEGKSNKILISTIGMHPSSAASKLKFINGLCGDFPYFMWKRFQTENIDFQFTQGAECAIYPDYGVNTSFSKKDFDPENKDNTELSINAIKFAKEELISYEDYSEYFGKKCAEKEYNDTDKGYASKDLKNLNVDNFNAETIRNEIENGGNHIKDGKYCFEIGKSGIFATKAYGLSQMILDELEGITKDNIVEPVINANFSKVTVNLDYSLLYFGAVSRVESYNVVKCPNKIDDPENGSETGYGIVTEVGYMTLGYTNTDKDESSDKGVSVTYVFTPGEFSPGLAYGTDDKILSKNQQQWQDKNSFSGEKWGDTIETIVKITNGEKNNVVVTGLTNDMLCYVFADTQIQHSVILAAAFNINSDYGAEYGQYGNNMLLTMGEHTASTLITAINKFFPSK